MKMTACAITDHGVLHGIVEFYKKAREVGIKPIIGVEAYITEDPDDSPKDQRHRDNKHMVLLAQDQIGLRNLFWLVSNSNLRNFYYNPRIWVKNLETRSSGLIATSACLGGVVAKRAKPDVQVKGAIYDSLNRSFEDPEGVAIKWARYLKEIFPDRFYLEIQDHPMWEQKAWNQWATKTGKKEDIPLVITNDAHYLRPEDKDLHELVMAQQYKQTLDEYRANKDKAEQLNGVFNVKPQTEMYKSAAKYGAPEAFWNTVRIAEECNVELELGKYQTPVFDVKKAPDYETFKKWKESQQK